MHTNDLKNTNNFSKVVRNLILIFLLALGVFFYDRAFAPTSDDSARNFSAAEAIPKTTLLAVGDILLSRNVGAKIEESKDPNLPFAKLRDFLADVDITFGNLECPFSQNPKPVREGLVFRCPTKYVAGLVNAGFDVLSTANNHSFDQGLDNLAFTVDYLKSIGIQPVGTGKTFAEANQGVIMTPRPSTISRTEVSKEEVKFGFLAFSYSARNDGGKSQHPQIATMHDVENLKSAILNLKSQGAEIVIVSMHAGTEYTRHPNQEQIDFAHAAIDAGADVVIGHHPHWIQNIEIYPPLLASPIRLRRREEKEKIISPPLMGGDKGKGEPRHTGIIFYSLGNFVFDQMWSQETREGLMVELRFKEAKLKTVKLIPVIIENYCCPRLADKKEKTKILKKVNLDSDSIQF